MKKLKLFLKGVLIVMSMMLVLGGMPIHSNAASPRLNKKKVTLRVGQTAKLKVKGSKKKVKWFSTRKSVCTVSKKGLVKAKKKGTATVKAKVGRKTLKCKVTVKAKAASKAPGNTPTKVKATGMQIVGASKVLAPGGSMQLSVKFLPKNARAEKVSWEISDRYRASVKNGFVTAGSDEGEVTITAYVDADNDDWKDSDEMYAEYTIQIKDIKVTGSVSTADGGDLLLSESGAKAVFSFAMSDTVPGVVVDVVDSVGTTVRSYPMGSLGEGVQTSCAWDLCNSRGAKVSPGSYCFVVKAVGAVIKSDYFNVYARSEFGGGNGSPTSPYQVSTVEQLRLVGDHNGVCFRQTANIDVNLKSFTPLFTWDVPFTGTYDGGGYSIQNVSAIMTGSGGIGIFSNVGEEGTVQNLTVEGGFFNGTDSIAAITGGNSGSISNCHVKNCSVTASGTDAATIAGKNWGIIKGCTTSGNTVMVQKYSGSAGGVCGYNKGTVTGCISSSDSIAGGDEYYMNIGGAVGWNEGSIIGCIITSSNIKGNCWQGRIGGVAGENHAIVANCKVSNCDISCTNSVSYIGGIIGVNKGNNVNNTYTGNLNQVGGE